MRATKAYIASLGTTGVLLGASILMLAVVSAVVAFDRWPNGHVSTRVETLVLKDSPTPIRVGASVPGTAVRRAAAAAPGAIRPTAGAPVTHAVAPTVVPPPSLPQFDPTPAGIANGVAQGTESTTGSLGVAVGQLSPETGTLVS